MRGGAGLGRACGGAILCLVLLGVPAGAGVPDDAEKSRVTHVSDGDTAYLKGLEYGTKASTIEGRKARFIGVDTPEVYTDPPDCYGKKASRFTTRKLEGERVKVTYGEDTEDQYGRALIYIWLDGKLFNKKLVRKGFATVEIYEPNDLYEKRLRTAEDAARENERGLWDAC